MPAKSRINLLPKRDSVRDLGERVVNWALTYGRHIIILTELVVVAAFLARFSLDQKLSDLYDSIGQKQTFIRANKEFEDEFRKTQKRQEVLGGAISKQFGVMDFIKSLAVNVPIGVRLENVFVSGGSVRLTVEASSEKKAELFIHSVANNPNLTNVSVSALTTSAGERELKFTVTAQIHPEN